jgi:hypothetical protein
LTETHRGGGGGGGGASEEEEEEEEMVVVVVVVVVAAVTKSEQGQRVERDAYCPNSPAPQCICIMHMSTE